jgi:Flp pilus assembly protein TadD
MGLLAFLLCGCETVHAPVIEPPPAVSATEKADRSRALYLSVIEELIKSGKAHAAMAHLDEYERSYGTAPAPQRLRADAWFALGDMAKAEAGYQNILTGEQAGYAKHGLGRVAAARGDWPAASQRFDAAVKDQPINPRFLNDLGCSLFRTGRMEEAEFTLRKAHELSPRDEEIIDNILVLLAKANAADRLDDVFADIADQGERARLHERLASYAGEGSRGARP